jgi:hypothetical protein
MADRPGGLGIEQAERLTRLFFPLILIVFLGLYVTSLVSGVDPELALLRSGLAALALALIGRLAIGILEAAARAADEDIIEVAVADEVGDGDGASADFDLDAFNAMLGTATTPPPHGPRD